MAGECDGSLSRLNTEGEDYHQLFPSLNAHDVLIIDSARSTHSQSPKKKGFGMILQIIMSKDLAARYCYPSFQFGRIKDESFADFYTKHKNRLDDDGQLRIAMGHPFTRYPSSVKIKALSPIFQDQVLMRMIHTMIWDITQLDPYSGEYKGVPGQNPINYKSIESSQSRVLPEVSQQIPTDSFFTWLFKNAMNKIR